MTSSPACTTASYLKKEGQKILDGNRSRVNALVFCDLDNLKFVNDNYGHEMGDHYLKAMADLLTDIAFGEQCMAVRLSGDEFVLFFYGYSERKTIEDKVRSGYEGAAPSSCRTAPAAESMPPSAWLLPRGNPRAWRT
ncbi:MAG: diguanylate cyclase domain-containing protein [Enterocloster bolteae]